MKVAFGTVVYQEGFAYAKELVDSINNQDYIEFDVLILNDNLQESQLNLLINNINKDVIVWENNDGFNPPQLRIELIKNAKLENYDLLVLGDLDDVFSDDRISSLVEAYDINYAFYYNNLFYYSNKQLFFKNIPKKVEQIESIIESNFIGLSNSALNLNLLTQDIINKLYKFNNEVFDWYLYSVLLNSGLRGKMVKGKTYYRIHNQNIAGESKNNIDQIIKEIDVKILHYDSLKDQHPLYKEKLLYYKQLKGKISKSKFNILNYIDYDNNYWWGKLNKEKIERNGLL